MPFITFTATPKLPRDMAHLAYKKGDVIELSGDSCERWIRRGVAEYTTKPEAPVAPVVVERAEVPVLPHAPEPVFVALSDELHTLEPAPFDPQTASVDDLREFLALHGKTPRFNTGEARLREMATDILAAQ